MIYYQTHSMMKTHFPVTSAISQDANAIMLALHNRSLQLKLYVDSQSILKKTSIVALKAIALLSTVITAASFPAIAISMTTTLLRICAISLTTAIASLAIYIFLNPVSSGELIIKDQWKSLFDALRKGKGQQILDACQKLARQKEKRASSFDQCLGSMPSQETTPFFHKVCLIGYLQLAINNLKNHEDEQAKSNVHLALSHFDTSGFSNDIRNMMNRIAESPKNMRKLIEICQAGKELHALDHLTTIKT